jgi:hypothetical protein
VRFVIGVHLGRRSHDFVNGIEFVPKQFAIDHEGRVVHLLLDHSLGYGVTLGQVSPTHSEFY